MNQIELINITKSYDKKTNVMENINVTVKDGEFFILVGPSGCGKSTLLRMVAGLEQITGGMLRIGGELANHLPPKDRKLSMVFQNYALFPHMTVKDNILFGLDVKRVPKEEQEKRLAEAAALTGLIDLLKRKPGQLSGGQRQRVALARSICSQSPICLMDEPLSNLDAKLRAQMRSEIRRIQKQLGLTIIYVTHDQVEAMTMGDRIMVLSEGRVQQIGTPVELYNRPANQFVAGFIGTPQMNFAEAVVQDNRIVINQDAVIRMDPQIQRDIPSGSRFQIGIRPDHITNASVKKDTSHPVTVVSTEFMGNETQVLFEIGESMFTARWPGQWEISPGAEVYVDLHPDCYHFFEPAGGTLLREGIRRNGDVLRPFSFEKAANGDTYE